MKPRITRLEPIQWTRWLSYLNFALTRLLARFQNSVSTFHKIEWRHYCTRGDVQITSRELEKTNHRRGTLLYRRMCSCQSVIPKLATISILVWHDQGFNVAKIIIRYLIATKHSQKKTIMKMETSEKHVYTLAISKTSVHVISFLKIR